MKLKKVEISKAEQEYYEKWCQRCDKYYCLDCMEFYVVGFDVEENMNSERLDLPRVMQNWKGEEVCPWCYNQLIDRVKNQKTP